MKSALKAGKSCADSYGWMSKAACGLGLACRFCMVAAHPVGAVLGHCRAVTVLGDAGRVLLGGMPELKNLRWTVAWCTRLGLENACSIKELRVYPLFLGWL